MDIFEETIFKVSDVIMNPKQANLRRRYRELYSRFRPTLAFIYWLTIVIMLPIIITILYVYTLNHQCGKDIMALCICLERLNGEEIYLLFIIPRIHVINLQLVDINRS